MGDNIEGDYAKEEHDKGDHVEEVNIKEKYIKESVEEVHDKEHVDDHVEDQVDEVHDKEKLDIEDQLKENLVIQDHFKEKHYEEDNFKEDHVKEDLDEKQNVQVHYVEDHDEFLNKFRVTTIPLTAYYMPEFITEEEERTMISNIYCAPKPKWEQLLNRRLQNWGGLPTIKGMVCELMPHWLIQYLNRIHALDIMNGNKPNHVLINEYLPGQGIMPHTDGSLFYATIATISLKSPTVLKFQEPRNDYRETPPHVFSLLLEPRSLLILKDKLFNDYLHSIEELTEDTLDDTIANLKMVSSKYVKGSTIPRDTRISLTIRNVPKARNFHMTRFW